MAAARLLARRTTAARGPWAPAWRAFSIADESSYHSGSDAGFSAVPRLFSAEYTSPLQYAGTPHAEPHVITLAAAEGIGDDGHRLEALAANLSDEADSTPVTPFADGPAAGSVTTGVDASVAASALPTPQAELIPVPDVGSDSAANAAVEALPELGYYPSHIVMQGIEALHVTTGLPYWATIIAATFGLRSMMLPLAFRTMRNSARMALLKPELQLVMDRMKQDPASSSDPKRQKMYQTQMNALFKKHDAYPMRSLQFPLMQLPVFMSFFFGLKSMGDYYPSISDGGALWFTDLSTSDPYMIFPVVTAASFVSSPTHAHPFHRLGAAPTFHLFL
jgi:hypothetical protein